jgi:hypothetical protein
VTGRVREDVTVPTAAPSYRSDIEPKETPLLFLLLTTLGHASDTDMLSWHATSPQGVLSVHSDASGTWYAGTDRVLRLDPITQRAVPRWADRRSFQFSMSGDEQLVDVAGTAEPEVLSVLWRGAGNIEWTLRSLKTGTELGSGAFTRGGTVLGATIAPVAGTPRVLVAQADRVEVFDLGASGAARPVDTVMTSGGSLQTAQLDGDPALELVTSGGAVLDLGTLAVQATLPDFERLLEIADVDGDGVDEILATEAGVDGVGVYDLQGRQRVVPAPGTVIAATPYDGDGDGDLDAAVLQVDGSFYTGSLATGAAGLDLTVDGCTEDRLRLIDDLDDDGSPDAVVERRGRYHRVDLTTGALEDIWHLPGDVPAPGLNDGFVDVLAADVDGDGRDEWVIGLPRMADACGIDETGRLLLHDPDDGSFRESAPLVPLPGGEAHQFDAADLDGDGREEVVVVGWSPATGTLATGLSWDGVSWQESWSPAIPLPAQFPYGVVTDDLDADGVPEVLVLTRNFHQFDATGASRWSTTVGYAPLDDVWFGDLEGDGASEIVAHSRSNQLMIVMDGTTGTELLYQRNFPDGHLIDSPTGDTFLVRGQDDQLLLWQFSKTSLAYHAGAITQVATPTVPGLGFSDIRDIVADGTGSYRLGTSTGVWRWTPGTRARQRSLRSVYEVYDLSDDGVLAVSQSGGPWALVR